MGVSKNRGTPKSSILIGFSLINHPFWGTPIFGNTHILSVQKVLLGLTPRSSESHTCCSWCASWPSPKPKTSLEAALDDWNSRGNHAKIRHIKTTLRWKKHKIHTLKYHEVPWSTGFPSANSAFNQYLSIAYPLWHTIEDGLASGKIEPLNRKMTPFQHSSKGLFIAKMLLAKQAGRITGPLPSLNIVAPENKPSQKDISSSNHQFSGAMLIFNVSFREGNPWNSCFRFLPVSSLTLPPWRASKEPHLGHGVQMNWISKGRKKENNKASHISAPFHLPLSNQTINQVIMLSQQLQNMPCPGHYYSLPRKILSMHDSFSHDEMLPRALHY